MAIHIDFKPVEHDAEFRSALLYYLQLTNSYIAAIFWDCSPDSARRKKLYAAVEAYAAGRKFDDQLRRSLVPKIGAARSGHLDV